MTTRIALKCRPEGFSAPDLNSLTDLEYDSRAAACYQQAIEEAHAQRFLELRSIPAWIEQRAAELLAEKLR